MPTAALPAAIAAKLASDPSVSRRFSSAVVVTRRASTAVNAAEVMAARCCRRRVLMELTGIGPHGELRHEVELPQELSDHLTGVVALAELLQLAQDTGQGLFGLTDGHIGIVLPLALEAGVVLQKLLPIELRQTLA